MTNKEVLKLYEGLNSILNNQELRFPAKVSFSMMRNLKTLEPIVGDMLTAKDKVLQTYGTPVEDKPGYYSISPENREAAQKELSALDGVEQEVQILKIKVSDLDGIELSLTEANNLLEMLED